MALRALDADPQEELRRRLGRVFRRARDPVEVGRGRVDRVPPAGQDLPCELVERPVFGELPHEVAVEVVHAPLGDRLPIAAHDVGPLQRPEARELVAFQQGVDELRDRLFGSVESRNRVTSSGVGRAPIRSR